MLWFLLLGVGIWALASSADYLTFSRLKQLAQFLFVPKDQWHERRLPLA
ncbi:MAG: hypothetical protein KC615_19275 [Anaerolineae bacterium]|nr:hypothetical protein [Anaerolineae bacterium]